MIRKKDFIDAIGEPDATFTAAVSSALSTVRGMESAGKPELKRRYGMIFPAAAAAVMLIAFIGFAVNGPMSEKPDPIKSPGALSQPKDAVTSKPTPGITVETEATGEVTIEPKPLETAKPAADFVTALPTATPVSEDVRETMPAVQATLEAEQPYEVAVYDENYEASANRSFWDESDFTEGGPEVENYGMNDAESIDMSRPGYYDLFEKALGQGFDGLLDEGFHYEETWLMYDGSICWIAGDGVEQYIICELFEEENAVIFKLNMPYSNVRRIEDFMANTPEWLSTLYYDDAHVYLEGLGADSKDSTLNMLAVKVDKKGEPMAVKMSFGLEYVRDISWEKHYDGRMEQASVFANGVLVYGYDSSFDTGADAETIGTSTRYNMFIRMFNNQKIGDLYPGYEVTRIVQEDKKTTAYYISDFPNAEIIACRITTETRSEENQYPEGPECATIRLFMPDDVERVSEFMANAAPWLAMLYFDDVPVVLEAYGVCDFEYLLTELMIMASPEGEPYACKMVFGEAEQYCIWWELDDNGDFMVIDFANS